MGSVSLVTDESVLYDTVYTAATDCLRAQGITVFRYADTTADTADVPETYAFLQQLHLNYEKDTLKPSLMRRNANLLCEINVTGEQYGLGKLASDALQRLFLKSVSEYGMSVDKIDSIATTTALGHKFVVSVDFNFNTVV